MAIVQHLSDLALRQVAGDVIQVGGVQLQVKV
jgi:hypothetical protein